MKPADLVLGLDEHNAEAQRGRVELLKLQFEYAWRSWQYNAQQRLTVFQFFVGLAAAGAGLYGVFMKEREYPAAVLIALFVVALSLIFLFLERRNEELVRLADDLLVELEEQALFPGLVFLPLPSSRRGILSMRAERRPRDAARTPVPLGIRRRERTDWQVFAHPKAEDSPVDRLRQRVRAAIGLGFDGQSPHRFGFWLPTALKTTGFTFLAAAAVAIALALWGG